MKKPSTRKMVLCALFAAATAVLSQLSIPLGPVPFNLATFAVLLSGALLGAKAGCASQIVYVLLGVCGLPVFSMFRAGPGVLIGPTGGYIAGYVLAAAATGAIAGRSKNRTGVLAFAMLAGFFAYMLTGTCWYMFSTKSGIMPALSACVFPFLPGEAVKMALAAILAKRLRPILRKKESR